MKHAFLIIVHHEFGILDYLIRALDDARNDIYIHFDKKVQSLPILHVEKARLYILENRVDVRWADISQIRTEFVLFEKASANGPYAYYHLISGVDMPLRSQDDIHRFFSQHAGKEFIGFRQQTTEGELDRKVRRYHLFPKHFRVSSPFGTIILRTIRFLAMYAQIALCIKRKYPVVLKKGCSWVSVTHDFVDFLLSHQAEVLKQYRNTFCSDEVFLHTLCWNSPFREKIFDCYDESRGSLRKINWKNRQLVDWSSQDFDELMGSDALFARKFSSKDMEVVKRIYATVQGQPSCSQ